MPQLQILERDASEGVKPFTSFTESFQKAQALTADMKYKKSLMDYNKELLKIKAKEATTEEEKLKYQHLKLKLEGVGKLTDIILRDAVDKNGNVDGKKAGEIFFGIAKDHPELAEALGGKDKDLSEWIPTGVPAGQQKEQAQAGKARAEAGVLNRFGGGAGRNQMPTMDISKMRMGEGGVPDVSQAVPPEQAGRMNAMGGGQGGGGMQVTGANIGGINMQDFGAISRGESMKTRARKSTELEIEMGPLRKSVDFYLKTFDQAVAEMGGSPDLAAAAHLKGRGAKLWAELGKRPATQALSRMSKSVVLMLASHANRGRPSDKDAEAMAGTLVSLTLAKDTNKIIKQYLQTIVGGSDAADIGGGQRYSPGADQLLNILEAGELPKEPFTIREK